MPSYRRKGSSNGGPPIVPPTVHAEAVWQRSTVTAFAQGKSKGSLTSRHITLSPIPQNARPAHSPSPGPGSATAQSFAEQRCASCSPTPAELKMAPKATGWHLRETADTRKKIREALRKEFDQCETLKALEDARDEALAVAAIADLEVSHAPNLSRLARQIDDGIRAHEWIMPRDAWTSIIQQLSEKEMQRRKPQLAIGAAMAKGVLSAETGPRLVIQTIDSIHATHHVSVSTRRASAIALPHDLEHAQPHATRGASTHSSNSHEPDSGLPSPTAPPDPKREMRWKTAFCRYVDTGKLRREKVAAALELCGFQAPNEDHIEKVFTTITRTLSLPSASEFVRFVHGYEALLRQHIYKAFQEADEDGSGSVDADELSEMLQKMGIEPMPRVLNSILQEVDENFDGQLSFQEFEELMRILRTREGFTKDEGEELTNLFQRFDCGNKGCIAVKVLIDALRWLGSSVKQEDMQQIVEAIDADQTGTIDYHEFFVCMRKFREKEIEMIRTALDDWKTANESTSSAVGVDDLYGIVRQIIHTSLNKDTLIEVAKEVAEEAEATFTLPQIWDVLQGYRAREGLTLQEGKEVEEAFQRYDGRRLGEIGVLDVGKALRWYGNPMNFDDQQLFISMLDVDKSGKLDLMEFRKLIRLYWEQEVMKMHNVFKKFDSVSEGSITEQQAKEAYKQINFVDSFGTGQPPKVPPQYQPSPGKIDLPNFISLGARHKGEMRKQFRENGGYSQQEIRKFERMFMEYDTDASGNITTEEVGSIIRDIFPVMSQSLRRVLDELLREVSSQGALDFQDFILMMRQFHDIQAEEKVKKEKQAAEETGFSQEEIQDFRELFLASMSEHAIQTEELTFADVKSMLMNICTIGVAQMTELKNIFGEAAKKWGKSNSGPHHQETIDFSEFLCFMERLLRINFASIKTKIGYKEKK